MASKKRWKFNCIRVNSDSFFKFLIFFFVGLLVIAAILVNFHSEKKVVLVNDSDVVMYFFYLDTCPHCRAQEEFHKVLLKEFPNLKILSYEMTSPEGRAKYLELAKRLNLSLEQIATPTTVIGDQVNIGFLSAETTGVKLRNMIKREIELNRNNSVSCNKNSK